MATTERSGNDLLADIAIALSPLKLPDGKQELLSNCFGTIALYLRSIGAANGSQFITIILGEIASKALVDSGQVINSRTISSVAATIHTLITDASEDKCVRTIKKSARRIPADGLRVVRQLLERIPVLGTILEIAAYSDLMIANKIITKADLRFDDLHEVFGLPEATIWIKSELNTIVINALNMGAFTHYFINFISTIARTNLGILAILVHDKGIFINESSELATIPLADCDVTIFTTSEKKILAISDIISQQKLVPK